MLYGEFQHNLDQKGRITVPLKFREDLGDKFYVCRGLDNCLTLYSEEKWQEVIVKVSSLPTAKAKSVQRFIFPGATDVEPDKQGRILLPASLREYASIDKEAIVAGVGDRAEIWNVETWRKYNSEQDDIEEIMGEFGL